MKLFETTILVAFCGVASALTGIEFFTRFISYTLPGSGQLGAFSQSTIDNCAGLCLKREQCHSFEFDLFDAICYLSKFNRKNYSLITSKRRNYYELHNESRNLVELNFHENKNEGFQFDQNVPEVVNSRKRQDLTQTRDGVIELSTEKTQLPNQENSFHFNPKQSNPSILGRLPNNDIGGNTSYTTGEFKEGKTKESVGRNIDDSKNNMIANSVINPNRQLPNVGPFGQEYKLQINRQISFDDRNRNFPSDINTETKKEIIFQEPPHLPLDKPIKQQHFIPGENMNVTTTSTATTMTMSNTLENDYRNAKHTTVYIPLFPTRQGENEVTRASEKNPTVMLNADRGIYESRKYRYSEIVRATERPEYYNTPAYTPSVYPVSSDNCQQCVFVESFCFVRDEYNCNQYIECFQEVGGGVRAYARKCAFGLFWDTKYNVCGRSSEVDCDAEPCTDGSLESYPYLDSCAAYWRCEKGRSVAGCCGEGEAYIEGSGCLPDLTCVNECSRIPNYTAVEKTIKNKECQLKPFIEDRRYYLEFVPGHGMRPRPCSVGTIYNHTLCRCVIGFIEVTKCVPELLLDFNGKIMDNSRNGLPLTVSGVIPQQGVGVFNNQSHIIFWRFSGAYIGNKLTIHINFKDTGSHTNQIEYLISNCYLSDHKKTSSVAVALNRRTSEVMMLMDTNKSEPKILRLKYTPNQWQEASLNYNGEVFQVQLGHRASDRVIMHGDIESRPSGLVVGKCGNHPSFTGLIKEVRVYLCNP